MAYEEPSGEIVSHKASDQNEIYVNEIGEIYTADNDALVKLGTNYCVGRWKFGFSSRIVKFKDFTDLQAQVILSCLRKGVIKPV